MKTKISNILGVGLALLMVFSVAFALVPTKVAAAEGNMQWVSQPLPFGGAGSYNILANGTNVTEIAIGPDGTTIYAIDGIALLNAAGAIYKSADAGQSWAALPAIAAASAVAINNIAVAPDNPSVIAVTNLGAGTDQAWISTDGGVTWAQLPAPNTAGATMAFMDIEVGPARGGTIYGRDYVLATADNAITVLTGSLQILGETATWTNIAAPGAVVDFVACDMSPNFVGDRIVFGCWC